MSRQNSNTSSVSPMLSSCDPPRSFPCRDIVVLPVRYALCSDKESSLGHAYHAFTRRFCPAAEMRHHYYTLRLLRPLSFLYAYVEGEADIVQFAVDGQSELRWKRGNSFMLRAERFWLRVSNLNQSVWLAVSDADWTDEFMTKVKGNPAPHMQQFCPATGNSEESLVVSSYNRSGEEFAADVGRLVQEFRDKPGYLRALHEYTDEIPPSDQAIRDMMERAGEDPDLIMPRPDNISLLFDPELEHLRTTEFTNIIVKARWQWASKAAPFLWQQELPEASYLNNLAATSCSLCIALADTVGLAMDCASLNSAAHRARQDLLSWYGDLAALAGCYQDTPIGRGEVQIIPEDEDSSVETLSGHIIAFLSKAQYLLQKYDDDLNATFWRKTLFSRGDWSFERAMQAHDLQKKHSAITAQRVFGACVCGLTCTVAGTRALYTFLTGEGAYLADMAADIIKSGIPEDIPCPPLQTEEGEIYEDPRVSLHLIVSAFSGVLMTPRRDGSLTPPAEKILKAALTAIEPYMRPLDESMQDTPLDALALWDMQLLDEDVTLKYGDPATGLYFNAFGHCVKKAKSGVNFLEVATMQGFSDLIYADWTELREKELGLIRFTKQGAKVRLNLEVKTTLGIKSVLKTAKCALSLLSAVKAAYDLCKAEDAGEVGKALLSGFSSVAATAQMVVSLQDTHAVYNVARINSTLPTLLSKASRQQALAARITMVQKHRQLTNLLKTGGRVASLARAGSVAGAIVSVWEAAEDFKNRDYLLMLADMLIGIASLLFPVAGCVRVATFLLCAGIYINLTQHRTSELTLFLSSAYLGIKSTHRPEIEKEKSFSHDVPRLNLYISPLSYRNKFTPPHALFPEKDCKIWNSRQNEVLSDLYAMELMKHTLYLEATTEDNGYLLKLYIFSSSVSHNSCLKILSATLNRHNIKELLLEASWSSMYVNNIPCWTCTIKNMLLTQRSYGLGSTVKYYYGKIDIEVEFTYSEDSEIKLASQKVYNAKLDYFKHKYPDKTDEHMLSEEIKKYMPEDKIPFMGPVSPYDTRTFSERSRQQILEREKEKEALINEIRNGSKYYIKREKLSCVLYEPTPITVEDEYME